MKAFSIDRYGSGARLRAGEMPDPVMREDDVLVQIHAADVNRLDSKIRNGEFKLILPYRQPLILGHDVAGVVIRVGSRVRRFKPGDEVYARPADGRIGAFAECIAIKEPDLALKPKAITMADVTEDHMGERADHERRGLLDKVRLSSTRCGQRGTGNPPQSPGC